MLSSFIKQSSDSLLVILSCFLFGVSMYGWYTLGYRPLAAQLTNLSTQNALLAKRTTSLSKRIVRSSQVQKELAVVEKELDSFAQQMPNNACHQLLTLIKESAVELTQWTPGNSEALTYFSRQVVCCELQGSFKDLARLLNALPPFIACTRCVITKQVDRLAAQCSFVVFSGASS